MQATSQPIRCGVCGQMFVAPPPPVQPPPTAIRPPHLQHPQQNSLPASSRPSQSLTQQSVIATKEEPDDDNEQSSASRSYGSLLGTLMLGGLVVVVLSLAIGLVIAVKGMPSFLVRSSTEEEVLVDPAVTTDSTSPDALPALWATAPRMAIVHSGVLVRIKRVEYGEVLGRNAQNEGQSASGGDYLKVYFQVENRRDASLDYVSWYGNLFKDGDTNTAARLTDYTGRRYSQNTFDSVKSVQGHTPRSTISPRDRIDDVLIFGVPQEVIYGSDEPLRLELPRSAIDKRLQGSYRFEIPRRMLSQF